ncbi:hypothetical protein HNR25_002473 [Streptomonospora salina]|uniref:Uncharacterized protein n=1 Tax=Streptomonospora salina TaxID=104205 RepID=A0A841E795_9ACTN|nr:hypothetical protein [Streptomonospora salina]
MELYRTRRFRANQVEAVVGSAVTRGGGRLPADPLYCLARDARDCGTGRSPGRSVLYSVSDSVTSMPPTRSAARL